MSSVKDACVVLLNDLIVHAGNFGAKNVMEYEDKELEAFETGVELSQAVKDERDAVRKQYDDDVIALNKLTKKLDIVKFI